MPGLAFCLASKMQEARKSQSRTSLFFRPNVSSWPIPSKVNVGPDVRYGEAKLTFMLHCDRRNCALHRSGCRSRTI